MQIKTAKQLFFLILVMFPLQVSAALFSGHRFGGNSAVLVVDQNGKTLYSKNEDKALIPASVIKVPTSIAAIEKFGGDYRFSTEFFVRDDTLWVKGYGDPYITSEELDLIVQNLKDILSRRATAINSIVADGTHFPVLSVPGRAATRNPYDAPLAAISVNFNTIKVRKSGNKVTSAEQQTPITPLAKKLAKRLSNGVHRINLVDTVNSEQYFAELLLAKLNKKGIKASVPRTGVTPLDAELIYQHKSSKKVEDAVHAMLFYSNNFIANQLFLQMRASGEPIGFASSSRFVMNMLESQLGPSDQRVKASIVEGSGLSRENKLTAEQLVAMLARFKSHKKLMKSYLQGKAYAKSGTLNGVQNLIGYITKNNKEYYFAFIFNDPVKWRFRNQLLAQLYREL